MLRIELLDGTSRYLTLERVLLVHPHSDDGMIVRFRNHVDEVQNLRARRFQIIKSATWYD
jgi:hypothetical protein